MLAPLLATVLRILQVKDLGPEADPSSGRARIQTRKTLSRIAMLKPRMEDIEMETGKYNT